MDRGLKILVIEDDPMFRAQVAQLLGVYNDIHEAGGLADARTKLERNSYNVVLLDKTLPDGNGAELIAEIKKESPATVVIVLTGDSDMSAVPKCLDAGAQDYIRKSENVVSELLIRIPLAISRASLEVRSIQLESLMRESYRYEILGHSPQTNDLRKQIAEFKGVQSPILITGESGTGKELIARRLHHIEGKANRPFIAVNAGALPETLIESELFGHKRGAFTSATEDRAGKFELADGGDLFLDEIGELPLALQAKLLRVIQEGEVTRLGDSKVRRVNVRIIAATNRPMEELLKEKLFREDLYYRLNVHRIQATPLRERLEDIADIAPMLAMNIGGARFMVAPEAVEKLQNHRWPGNVRELRNFIERAVFQARRRNSSTVEPQDIQLSEVQPSKGITIAVAPSLLPETAADLSRAHFDGYMQDAEKAYFTRALALCEGDSTETGRRMGIGRSTVFLKLRQLGLLKKFQKGPKPTSNTSERTQNAR